MVTVKRLRCVLVAFFALGTGWNGLVRAAEPAYHLLKKIPVGGEGNWDYLTLDAQARRLYIARFNRVTVVDVDKEKVVGEVADTPGVHGVALVPKLGRGFSSNGGDSTVTMFDLKTLRAQARIKVGQGLDAIVYDPASGRVFTMNAGSKDSTAINAETGKVEGTVKLGGRPEFATADEQGQIYVNLEDKDQVVAFDARELTVSHTWPISPGKEPTGLAMDRAHRRLFVTCHNEKMVILDADSGKVIASPAIGKGTDACIFDPETALAFSSNGDGTLTVVHEDDADTFRVVANVTTQRGARTMALDSKTHNIYLATANFKTALPAKAKGKQRPGLVPNSFVILVVGSK